MKFIFPKLPLEYGVHHGKMMILYYKHKVRVIITTANLIHVDYEKKTQGLWYQDFPKKAVNKQTKDQFSTTLIDYVSTLGVDTSKLHHYDFSSANVILLTSVPGYHRGATVNKYGHMQLRAALKQEVFHESFRQSDVLCQVIRELELILF